MGQRWNPELVFKHAVQTDGDFTWRYETDEFHGICELAHDDMVVKCVFSCTGRQFYDVLMMDGVIKSHLTKPTSVERLADNLSAEFPDLCVTVAGRAKTHGWITATSSKRWQ